MMNSRLWLMRERVFRIQINHRARVGVVVWCGENCAVFSLVNARFFMVIRVEWAFFRNLLERILNGNIKIVQ
jgi:hypothetical protein